MTEQFEDRPLIAEIHDDDYLLISLHQSGFIARPCKAAVLREYIGGEGPSMMQSASIRSADIPPNEFQGVWLEPQENQPDQAWIRAGQNWVSLARFATSGVSPYLRRTTITYLPAMIEGAALYIENFFFSAYAYGQLWDVARAWDVKIAASIATVTTPIVTARIDEGEPNSVVRVSAWVGQALPISQVSIFRVELRKIGIAPNLSFASYGLTFRTMRTG